MTAVYCLAGSMTMSGGLLYCLDTLSPWAGSTWICVSGRRRRPLQRRGYPSHPSAAPSRPWRVPERLDRAGLESGFVGPAGPAPRPGGTPMATATVTTPHPIYLAGRWVESPDVLVVDDPARPGTPAGATYTATEAQYEEAVEAAVSGFELTRRLSSMERSR